MWVNTPPMGLISSDPDYSAESDYPANMVKVILNGANGYKGLCSQCLLFVEDTNETWNFNSLANYFAWMGVLHCGIPPTDRDYNTYSTLHAQLVMQDIKKSGYANDRVKYVLGGWGSTGIARNNANFNRITGNQLTGACSPETFVTGVTKKSTTITSGTYNNSTGVARLTLSGSVNAKSYTSVTISDAKGTGRFASLNGTWRSVNGTQGTKLIVQLPPRLGATTFTGGKVVSHIVNPPIDYFDYFAIAPYFAVSTRGSRNFYQAHANTYAARWASDAATFGTDSPQALADIDRWIAGMQSDTTGSNHLSVNDWQNEIMPCLASFLGSGGGFSGTAPDGHSITSGYCHSERSSFIAGKSVINYEGGWNIPLRPPIPIRSMSCAPGKPNVVTVSPK